MGGYSMLSKGWKVIAIFSIIVNCFLVLLAFSLSFKLFEIMSTPAVAISVTKSEQEMTEILLNRFADKTKSLNFEQYFLSVGTANDERGIGTVSMTQLLAATAKYELPLYKINRSSIRYDNVNKEIIIEMPDLIETIEQDRANSRLIKASSGLNLSNGAPEYEREALDEATENQQANVLRFKKNARESLKSQLELIVNMFFQGFGKDLTVKCYYPTTDN